MMKKVVVKWEGLSYLCEEMHRFWCEGKLFLPSECIA